MVVDWSRLARMPNSSNYREHFVLWHVYQVHREPISSRSECLYWNRAGASNQFLQQRLDLPQDLRFTRIFPNVCIDVSRELPCRVMSLLHLDDFLGRQAVIDLVISVQDMKSLGHSFGLMRRTRRSSEPSRTLRYR